MRTDISKLCADFLRVSYADQAAGKLKASHARELVAAFFGYKSHAALIAEKTYPLDNLEEASILIPDIPLIEQRRSCLNELPDDLLSSKELASSIAFYLDSERYIGGDIWLYDNLEAYITGILLIDSDSLISDQIADVMAETNAGFGEYPYYENAKINDKGDELEIVVTGTHSGTPLDDKPFSGDTVDFGVRVVLPRIAGKRGFLNFELEAGGVVNDDWVDPAEVWSVWLCQQSIGRGAWDNQ